MRAPTPSIQEDRGVAPAEAPLAGAYEASVVEVIDGDTVAMRVRIWPGQEVLTHVRLRGIDAPELKARCAQEAAGASAARDRLAALVASGPVMVSRPSPDKYYGRVVADIVLPDGRTASAVLRQEKLVRPYSGKHREPWCDVSG